MKIKTNDIKKGTKIKSVQLGLSTCKSRWNLEICKTY